MVSLIPIKFQFQEKMDVNHIVIEYPRGMDITVLFVNATGAAINTFGMAPPLLLRLGPQFEFVSAATGNLLTLLGRSEADADATNIEEDKDEEDDNAMEDEDPDPNTTIDLVTSDDDDDSAEDDDDDDDDEDGYNSDLITISHPTDA